MNNITSREEDEEFERMVRRLDWAEHILPKCSLKSIDEPTDLRDYLKAQGWAVLEAAIKDRLYVLENKKFPQRQLAYPMDMTAPDYRESLDRVFWKLGDITGQKLENVLIDEPTKEWVGLMDEDMKDPRTHNFDFIQGARWAEALLKERNK